MKSNIYTIKDNKAGLFGPVFLLKNNFVALRTLADEMNKQDSVIGKHPEDYALYCVGEFDEDTGEINGKPVFVENASNLVSK